MKTSAICVLGSLLVSIGTYANGVIPVLDLDFTRAAVEALKKRGINDACIIAASNPRVFTYCREGSSTLWKYQVADLEQLATIQTGEKVAVSDFGQITVAEANSTACQQDGPVAAVGPTIGRGLTFSLIGLFLLIGLLHTFRAMTHGRYGHTALPDTRLQQPTDALPAHHSAAKALRAFGIAAAVSVAYFAYIVFFT
ncbi:MULTISPECIES: hypothetical protein [unclassified Pseudomonas]|uniref:Uncharacterized protein n=1 Tax=Pseudomonas sp. MYb327 TaxID=2745230 RepID=A0AAU8EA91_9PSED